MSSSHVESISYGIPPQFAAHLRVSEVVNFDHMSRSIGLYKILKQD